LIWIRYRLAIVERIGDAISVAVGSVAARISAAITVGIDLIVVRSDGTVVATIDDAIAIDVGCTGISTRITGPPAVATAPIEQTTVVWIS
jgi:hypothetical protein